MHTFALAHHTQTQTHKHCVVNIIMHARVNNGIIRKLWKSDRAHGGE